MSRGRRISSRSGSSQKGAGEEKDKLISPALPPYLDVPKVRAHSCHSGNVFVFEDSNVSYFGGGEMRGAVLDFDMLGLCLQEHSSSITRRRIGFFGFKPSDVLARWAEPRMIHVPIEDGGTPALPRRFWEDLLQELRRLAAEEDGLKVLVFCMGGHGRTGIALSILYGLCFPETEDPIEEIRLRYCEEAVETVQQARYIYRILNIEKEPDLKDYGGGASALTKFSYKDADPWDW